MPPLALEALGVSKRYGEREALCCVDLVVQPGRLHGLLGPNGAGKSTLMRVLLGLIRRDAGTVRLFGRGIDALADPLPDGVAGFVETPAFYPYLSGRRNLALLARLDGHQRSREGTPIDHALAEVGLTGQADRNVAGYSAGMRQRLALAATLLRSPRLLFLDEPTSALDPEGARGVRALTRRLAAEGAAVVLSSHDMVEVEGLCAELTVLNHGRVVFSGTVDELRHRAPASVYMLRTSDDRTACDLASRGSGVTVAPTSAADGALQVSAHPDALDAYVIALGCAGVAVRALDRQARSLESLFIELTADGRVESRPQALAALSSDTARTVHTLAVEP